MPDSSASWQRGYMLEPSSSSRRTRRTTVGRACARRSTSPARRVADAVTMSGLWAAGRGLPHGHQVKTVLDTPADRKYVGLQNADEGDSGTFSRPMCMEGDPYLLLEGARSPRRLRDAGLHLPVRVPDAERALTEAIERARAERGSSASGSSAARRRSSTIPRRGAGAYVCGEETALLESLRASAASCATGCRSPRSRVGKPGGAQRRPSPRRGSSPTAAISARAWHRQAAQRHAATCRGTWSRAFVEVPGRRPGVLIDFTLARGRGAGACPCAAAGAGAGRAAGSPFRPRPTSTPPTKAEASASGRRDPGHGGVVALNDAWRRRLPAPWSSAPSSCGKCTPCRIGPPAASR